MLEIEGWEDDVFDCLGQLADGRTAAVVSEHIARFFAAPALKGFSSGLGHLCRDEGMGECVTEGVHRQAWILDPCPNQHLPEAFGELRTAIVFSVHSDVWKQELLLCFSPPLYKSAKAQSQKLRMNGNIPD